MDIEKARKEIDKIDRSILKLFAQRFNISQKVALVKFNLGIPIRDRKREKGLIADRAQKFNALGFDDYRFIKKIYKIIFKKSRKIQKQSIKAYKKNGV